MKLHASGARPMRARAKGLLIQATPEPAVNHPTEVRRGYCATCATCGERGERQRRRHVPAIISYPVPPGMRWSVMTRSKESPSRSSALRASGTVATSHAWQPRRRRYRRTMLRMMGSASATRTRIRPSPSPSTGRASCEGHASHVRAPLDDVAPQRQLLGSLLPGRAGRSRICRTRRRRMSGVMGFWSSSISSSTKPWLAMDCSVYPDI